jgi:hypothetical protein
MSREPINVTPAPARMSIAWFVGEKTAAFALILCSSMDEFTDMTEIIAESKSRSREIDGKKVF